MNREAFPHSDTEYSVNKTYMLRGLSITHLDPEQEGKRLRSLAASDQVSKYLYFVLDFISHGDGSPSNTDLSYR